MRKNPTADISKHFSKLGDLREQKKIEHRLLDMVVITICAVICGADGWVDIETFGNAKRAWFSQFLELPNGIPSHDTFGRVFSMISPVQFQKCFMSWIQALTGVSHLRCDVFFRLGRTKSHSVLIG